MAEPSRTKKIDATAAMLCSALFKSLTRNGLDWNAMSDQSLQSSVSAAHASSTPLHPWTAWARGGDVFRSRSSRSTNTGPEAGKHRFWRRQSSYFSCPRDPGAWQQIYVETTSPDSPLSLSLSLFLYLLRSRVFHEVNIHVLHSGYG